MNACKLKKFICIFFVSIILLSLFIPHIEEGFNYVIAATVNGLDAKGAIKSNKIATTAPMLPKINGTAVPETTKRKPVGHAVEGAEYHDELWEKYSVIAAEDGGGNGKGGGSSSKHSQVIGNKGEYDEMGGVFGGNGGNMLGEGGFGSSGSATADELRKMKAAIDESRAASIANEIENKLNQESIRESIAESESIAASIQRKLQQEAVKATLNIYETPYVSAPQKKYSAPQYNPDIPINRIVVPETQVEMPTAAPRQVEETERRLGAVINKERLNKPVDALAILKEQINTPQIQPEINAPTAAAEPNTIAPPENAIVEPNAPTIQYYEEPIIDPVSHVEPSFEEPEPVDTVESSIRESEKKDDEKEQETNPVEKQENEGANGGENPEEDVDKKGEADSEEKSGDAKDKGLLHKAKEEEFKGKKVFELDTTGDLGLNPDIITLLNTKIMMMLLSMIMLLIGAATFLFRQRDKRSKKNYF